MVNPRSWVYFVRAGSYVKIGCSQRLLARIQAIQVGNPKQIELLRFVPGDDTREAEFHKLLRQHHARGEWFRYCPEVEAIVMATKAEEETALADLEREADARDARDVELLREAYGKW